VTRVQLTVTRVQLTVTSASTSRLSTVNCFGAEHHVPNSIEILFSFELQNVDGTVGCVCVVWTALGSLEVCVDSALNSLYRRWCGRLRMVCCDEVHRLYRGVLYCQNTAQSDGTKALPAPNYTSPSSARLLYQFQSTRTTVDSAYSRLPLMYSSPSTRLWSCGVSKLSKLDEQCTKRDTDVLTPSSRV